MGYLLCEKICQEKIDISPPSFHISAAPAVVYQGGFTIGNQPYNSNLADTSSPEYKELTEKLSGPVSCLFNVCLPLPKLDIKKLKIITFLMFYLTLSLL